MRSDDGVLKILKTKNEGLGMSLGVKDVEKEEETNYGCRF